MIAITASEKKLISKRFPDIPIVRTMKQDSKRHHYYMVEVGTAVRYLNRIRATGVAQPRPSGE